MSTTPELVHGLVEIHPKPCELALARLVRPDEARPCWYLYEVWSSLAQRQPAQRWLREADNWAPFSFLTPTEYRELQLTRQREQKARNF